MVLVCLVLCFVVVGDFVCGVVLTCLVVCLVLIVVV